VNDVVVDGVIVGEVSPEPHWEDVWREEVVEVLYVLPVQTYLTMHNNYYCHTLGLGSL